MEGTNVKRLYTSPEIKIQRMISFESINSSSNPDVMADVGGLDD